jgi:hypothetical protein
MTHDDNQQHDLSTAEVQRIASTIAHFLNEKPDIRPAKDLKTFLRPNGQPRALSYKEPQYVLDWIFLQKAWAAWLAVQAIRRRTTNGKGRHNFEKFLNALQRFPLSTLSMIAEAVPAFLTTTVKEKVDKLWAKHVIDCPVYLSFFVSIY